MGTPGQITVPPHTWQAGDPRSINDLIARIYPALKSIAAAQMSRERFEYALQPADLINEAYLRLRRAGEIDWQDRAHFLAIAAKLMRQVLVDSARKRSYLKNGAATVRVSLDSNEPPAPADPDGSLSIRLALEALERADARQARVVELRFFGGFSVMETAEALGVSEETVYRDWRLAKAWLIKRFRGNEET